MQRFFNYRLAAVIALVLSIGASIDAAPPAPATVKITRVLSHQAAKGEVSALGRRMLVEGEPMPEGYEVENSWLILREPPSGETTPLYRCEFESGKGLTLSRLSSSPGMSSHEIVGYVYTQPGPGRIELRSVRPVATPGEGYFVTDFTNCEGKAYCEEEFLGYAYRTIPYEITISVSPTTISPGDDLTITWKTEYVPQGQQGRSNEFPDRILGLTLSPALVSGAFLDREGKMTGKPESNPFAKDFPLSGSIVWNTSRNISDEYAQKLIPGEYQIQFALFPKCMKLHTRPCEGELEDILFTASEVFTVVDPSAN